MSLPSRRFVRIDALRFRRFRRLLPVPVPAGGLVLALVLAGGLLPAESARAAITNVRVEPGAFSPNSDGIRDFAMIRWVASTPPDSVRVEIRPSTQGTLGPYVRAFAFGPSPAGADSVTWDGRDSTGADLPEVQYTARVFELDSTGVRIPGSEGSVAMIVDRTAPPVPTFDEGIDGRDTTVAQFEVTGLAPASDSIVVYLGGVPFDTVRVSPIDSTFAVPVTLVEGLNSIAVQGIDRAGNISALSLAVSVRYRNIADITLFAPRPFEVSPNGDGVLDTARVELRIDAPTTRLLVQVRPAVPYLTGTTIADTSVVVTLYDEAIGEGTYLFEWDARDSNLVEVPDGSWFFFAQAESLDVSGNPVPGMVRHTRTVLDRVAPSIPEASPPPPARTTHNSVVLTGVPTGTMLLADTTIVWKGETLVGRASGVARWSIPATLTLGANTFTFQAADRAGNRSAIGNPVTIVYEEPLGFHAPERFRANDLFEINLERPARTVLIELFDLSGRLVRRLSQTRTDVRYELPWNLLDDLGVGVGDGPYVARATVTYLDGVVETRKGAIVVAK